MEGTVYNPRPPREQIRVAANDCTKITNAYGRHGPHLRTTSATLAVLPAARVSLHCAAGCPVAPGVHSSTNVGLTQRPGVAQT